MNIDKLREELTFDEGCINKIYLDHLGYATFGIGHLVLETDAEHGQKVGTPVSEERVKECFEKDIQNVFEDLDRNMSWWKDLPEDLSLERIYLMRNYGAEVVLTPANHSNRQVGSLIRS